jgi:hypothetical protein
MTHSTVPHAPPTHATATPANRRFGTGILIGALAGLGVVAAIAFGSGIGTRLASVPLGPMESRSYEQPLDGISRATMRLQFGAGQLTVGPLENGNGNLATATYDGPSRYVPESTYRAGDGVGELSYVIRDAGDDLRLPFVGRVQDHARMDVRLARGTPLTLGIEAGAAESRLDLSALQITDLDLQTGVASTRVRLPEAAGHTAVSVKGGVTEVTLDVPHGVAADIQVSDGLAGRQIDERRFRPMSGGHYRSPDYEAAPNRVDMHIELGLASLTIQ